MLKRELYLKNIRPFYDSNLIKILVGIRRCGKSVILEQIRDELIANGVSEEHIIFINFEYIEYEELLDYKKFNSYIKERIIDDKIYYLFFDEIQSVINFERVINSLRASLKNVSIFITGSNSRLMADELSTVLSGRYVSFKINPLSFREILELTHNKSKEEVLRDYLKWGSLPNRFNFTNEGEIKNYLHDVFDSIVLRDVVQRLNIRDSSLFNLIFQYVIDIIGREFSAENIVNYLKHEGKEVSTQTIYAYLEALRKAFLIKKIYRYNVHGKGIFKTLYKFYVTDLGIASIKNTNMVADSCYGLENIVYNELLIKGYEVYIGKTKKGEVDFVAIKDNKKVYFQVTTTLELEETKKREFGAFSCIDDNYPKYVISLDKGEYEYMGIKHINIIDFLLSEDI